MTLISSIEYEQELVKLFNQKKNGELTEERYNDLIDQLKTAYSHDRV